MTDEEIMELTDTQVWCGINYFESLPESDYKEANRQDYERVIALRGKP